MTIRRTIVVGGTLKRGPQGSGKRGGREVLLDTNRLQNVVFTGLKGVSEKALQQMGDAVLEATLPLVPIDVDDPLRGGGALRDTGRVIIDKEKSQVRVTFGGADILVAPTRNAPDGIVDYAVVVHERTDLDHKVGQAKYLEAGARLAADKVRSIYKNAIKAETKKAGKKK